MTLERIVAQAARNNALWCDAMCGAHRGPGEFHESYWIHRGPVPPFTSKLITLDDSKHAAEQREAIGSLIDDDPEAHFSIKDAFQCLDLSPLGFHVMFRATWILSRADAKAPADPDERLEWSVVEDAKGLDAWESAWRGSTANVAARSSPRVFSPSLLPEPGIHFLAGKRNHATVACGALNRSGDVVGLSNVFSANADAGPLFPGCLRLARALHPGIPIVGYERGDDLLAAERAGFAQLHPLTVWTR